MSIQLKPTSAIIAGLGLQPDGPIQKSFTNMCYEHMDRFVPRRAGSTGGSLRETVTIEPNRITYEMPYAEYQYYGIRKDGTRVVMNYTTPGTGPYWDERMWTVDGRSIIDQIEKQIKRGG